jgi:hypothetical protein
MPTFKVENFRLSGDQIEIDYYRTEGSSCAFISLPISRLSEWAEKNQENVGEVIIVDNGVPVGIDDCVIPIEDWIATVPVQSVEKFLNFVLSSLSV